MVRNAAGFYFNSNLSGIVLCFGFLITVDIIWSNFKLAYALFVFLGIVLTQSRGGITIFAFLLLSTFFRNSYSLKSALIIGFIGFWDYWLFRSRWDKFLFTRFSKNVTNYIQ